MRKLLRKQLYKPEARRINTQSEVRKRGILNRNLARTLNRKLIDVFNEFGKKETKKFLESNDFNLEQAQKNLYQKLVPILENHYRKIVRIIFRNNEKKYGFDKKEDVLVFGRNVSLDQQIKRFLQERGLVIFSGMSLTMSKRLRNIIAKEFESDKSLPEIEKAIIKQFSFVSRTRAALIARTETSTALGKADNDYHKLLASDTGIYMKKTWVAVNDGRTRDGHRETSNKYRNDPIDIDADFDVIGPKGIKKMGFIGDPRGGPENVINCRCVISYISADDIVDEED